MGHTIGQVLRSNGLRVITCLEERSERTKRLAKRAGIEDVATYQALVGESDVVLSILVPAEAFSAARVVAQAISETHADILFADCNAIAPQSVAQIGELIRAAGGNFVDAGIIGPPPRKPGSTRIYASGSDVDTLAELNRSFPKHIRAPHFQPQKLSNSLLTAKISTTMTSRRCVRPLPNLGISGPFPAL
jgi:3-hydroxyisobutyrate dehydrogenase-like beta-hydroxyacid dehydrogenase